MMRLVTTTALLLLATTWSLGQTNACNSVFTIVDQMPLYENGISDFYDDFGKLKLGNGCRPEDLTRVSWIVDKEGDMIEIEVKVLNKECGPAIVKQLEAFSKWTPGKQDGKKVCVRMTLPIHIRGSR
jgi:hypothetical protein